MERRVTSIEHEALLRDPMSRGLDDDYGPDQRPAAASEAAARGARWRRRRPTRRSTSTTGGAPRPTSRTSSAARSRSATSRAAFPSASLIINLLPIVDDFERAFGSIDSNLAGLTWLDGLRLIYRKLVALLENAGVRPIAGGRPAVRPALPRGGGARRRRGGQGALGGAARLHAARPRAAAGDGGGGAGDRRYER